MLIAAGRNVVTVGHRLGHGMPGTMLNFYGHGFAATDTVAASAIDTVLRKR